MPFIKTQKIVRGEDGSIQSGSAAIVDTVYDKNSPKYHAKHTVRERLGKVLYLAEDKRSGIFSSPTRGLVFYSAAADRFDAVESNDPRISATYQPGPLLIHTVFGDTYLLLKFLEKQGLIPVLKSVFQKKSDFLRLLGHSFHGVLRDGSRINVRDFLEKSFLSYLLDGVNLESMRSDSAFFSQMGRDDTRMAFFTAFVKHMRKEHPAFGCCCYVDSTPLPNDEKNNPFNALCSHGLECTSVQMRLILVLDELTGLPVWFDLIPGNVLDLSTVMNVVNDVAISLDIDVQSLVLDAGYICQDLIKAYHIGTEKSLIGRMPAKKGYPFKEMYWQVKPLIGRGKYEFVRNEHSYFGKRKDIEIFGQKEYAYVYVDHENALSGFRHFLRDNEDEYREMRDKDKDWLTVKNGFFILVSNQCETPEDMLTNYFERTNIETVFKTSKSYLNLLPLAKWTDETVRGKLLYDIINTIVYLQFRSQIDTSGFSVSEMIGKTQSLMCCRSGDMVTVEPPNKQTKKFYELMGVPIPAHVSLKKELSALVIC